MTLAQAEFAHEFPDLPARADEPVDALPQIEDRFGRLLERGLGLAPTPHMLGAFIAQSKIRAHNLGIEEQTYVRQLELGGPAARTEWMAVAPALVVGETFLFRDAQLWKLIESTLLPGLSEISRPVWLWSAGCSTGEEAYTLAIVARRALGDGAARILATDVNPKAIAAARVGVYGQWSLRGVDADKRDGLTVNGTQTVRVHEDVKSLVRFETHNLNDAASYPPAGMQSFEMIVCRNVLIYMSLAARAKIINNLSATLSPGGVLILGHGEAAGIEMNELVVERHDAGVVFRRPLHPIEKSEHKPAPPAKAPPKRSAAAPKLRLAPEKRATHVTHKERKHVRPSAVDIKSTAPAKSKSRELLAAAMQHARLGKLGPAERDAAAAMAADSLDPEPHVLVAALMMARSALREAETELRRALFLDPVFVPALWQIGNLYGITDRKRQALFAFARALTQLEGLPPESEALPFDNLTVGELSTLLRAELGERIEA